MAFRSPQAFFRRLVNILLLLQVNYVLAGLTTDFSIPPGLADPAADLYRLSQKDPLVPGPDTPPAPSPYSCASKHWVIISDPLAPDTDNIAIQLPSQYKGYGTTDETGPFYPLTRGLNKISTQDGPVYIQLLSIPKPLSVDNGDGDPELPDFSEKVTESNPYPDRLPAHNQTGNGTRRNNCQPELLRNGQRYTPYIAEADLAPFLNDRLWLFPGPDGQPYLHVDDDRAGPPSKALVIIKGYCPALFVTDEDGSSLTLLCDDFPKAPGTVQEVHDNHRSIIFSYNAAGVLMVTIRTPDGQTETMTAEEYRNRKSIWFEGLIEKMTTGGIDHTRQPESALNPVLPVRIRLYQPETERSETTADTKELTDGDTPSTNAPSPPSSGTPPAPHIQQQLPASEAIAENNDTGHSSASLNTNQNNIPEKVRPRAAQPPPDHLKVLIKGTGTKKDKESYLQEISICLSALLNSDGGTLTVRGPAIKGEGRNDWARIIEQKVMCSFGQYIYYNFIKKNNEENALCYTIYASPEPCNVSPNCCIMTDEQVNVLSDEKLFKQILRRPTAKPIKCQTSDLVFIQGEKPPLPGNEQAVFKHLKSEESKRTTLADRITGKSNKLTHYVSGMANGDGGAIYYGVDNNGNVQGERITSEGFDNIRNKVAKAVARLFHSGNIIERGTHWNIEFREVLHEQGGSPVPDTYVIVLTVAALNGCVFLESPGPEAYWIQNGRIERMPWANWLSKFMPADPGARSRLNTHITMKKYWHPLEEIYADFRDGIDTEAIRQRMESQAAKTNNQAAQQLLEGLKIIRTSAKGLHRKAHQLLQEYERDENHPDIPRQYTIWLRSILGHESGTISLADNYNRLCHGLLTTRADDGVMQALLNLQAGLVAMEQASEIAVADRSIELSVQAVSNFENALKYARLVSLECLNLGTHLTQEAIINKAIAILWTGRSWLQRDSTQHPEQEEILIRQFEDGKALISQVEQPLIENGILNIQYHLALSLLSIRKWQINKEKDPKFLRNAYKSTERCIQLISTGSLAGTVYKGLALRLRSLTVQLLLKDAFSKIRRHPDKS